MSHGFFRKCVYGSVWGLPSHRMIQITPIIEIKLVLVSTVHTLNRLAVLPRPCSFPVSTLNY